MKFKLPRQYNYFNKTYVVCLFAMLATNVYSQVDSIDIFITKQMQQRKIPGLQLAIVRNGKIIKMGNYGFANVQDSIPVSNQTVFTINSITKAFTGVAILQLVEAGKLKLAAPVSAYLSNLPQTWQAVTVEQLLSHTSGIPDIVDEEESVLINGNEEAAWKITQALPIDFKPGEQFRYNQTNYLLLGRIIDTLSGMPFSEFIKKEQLSKVGMSNTIKSGFGATKDIVPHAAAGYTYSKGKLVNMFFSFPPFLQTAAGMSSTAKEMADWIIALQSGQLLKDKSSITALWQPALLNNGKTGGFSSLLNGYAAGWPIISRAEHRAAAPVGGGRSAVFVYPDDNLSIVVLTNLSGGAPDAFIDELAGLFIPDMKAANGFGLSAPLKLIRNRIEKTGYKNIIPTLKEIKKDNQAFELAESEVNRWGYQLIKQDRIPDALEIFKLNVFMYPASANAFDSLAELYASMGEKTLAIENYQQSLKLNPANKNAAIQIQKLQAGK